MVLVDRINKKLHKTEGELNREKVITDLLIRQQVSVDQEEKTQRYQEESKISNEIIYTLMGEGFILLTRGYGFMGGCTNPLLTR